MLKFSWLDNLSRKSRPDRYADAVTFVVAVGVVSLVACIASYLLHFHTRPIGESDDWGSFGAFVSGIAGTILSLGTLIALAFTLILQAQELSESRALANTQSKILEKQSATMAQQAFDSVFFNLLERFSQVRDSVRCEYTKYLGEPRRTEAKGRAAFVQIYKGIQDSVGKDNNQPNRAALLQHVFKSFYELHESELGPYYRTLYHIFKFVHLGPHLTTRQKIDYANIARAQLSDTELCVLFYDGLTDLAIKFKPLIERYGVLKHVNSKHLLHPDDKTDESFYKRSAFESQEVREAVTVP
jgi:Putative phage abortive infection protein